MKIGITYSESRYPNYPNWIKGDDANIEIVELHWEKHSLDEVWDEIEECDGLVLTGGVDTHPSFYDSERLDYPNRPEQWNEERDEFEMHAFETALNFNVPVLAICRGHQLVNVALGGTLVHDLEENGKKDHRRHGEIDGQHELKVKQGSLLGEVAGTTTGSINSAHHQSIGELADELQASAYSPDEVIEAVEWKDKSDKPWLLAVQWHPERMKDKEINPFAINIRQAFLKAIEQNTK